MRLWSTELSRTSDPGGGRERVAGNARASIVALGSLWIAIALTSGCAEIEAQRRRQAAAGATMTNFEYQRPCNWVIPATVRMAPWLQLRQVSSRSAIGRNGPFSFRALAMDTPRGGCQLYVFRASGTVLEPESFIERDLLTEFEILWRLDPATAHEQWVRSAGDVPYQ